MNCNLNFIYIIAFFISFIPSQIYTASAWKKEDSAALIAAFHKLDQEELAACKLHSAIDQRKLHMLPSLLAETNVEVRIGPFATDNQLNTNNPTPLLRAAYNFAYSSTAQEIEENSAIMKLLMQNKADSNAVCTSPYANYSVLSCVTQAGHVATVQLLIAAKANAAMIFPDGGSALATAAYTQAKRKNDNNEPYSAGIIPLLLNNGAQYQPAAKHLIECFAATCEYAQHHQGLVYLSALTILTESCLEQKKQKALVDHFPAAASPTAALAVQQILPASAHPPAQQAAQPAAAAAASMIAPAQAAQKQEEKKDSASTNYNDPIKLDNHT
jgi:hypothetical protein